MMHEWSKCPVNETKQWILQTKQYRLKQAWKIILKRCNCNSIIKSVINVDLYIYKNAINTRKNFEK